LGKPVDGRHDIALTWIAVASRPTS